MLAVILLKTIAKRGGKGKVSRITLLCASGEEIASSSVQGM
jgi:hypothetical protein